MRLHHSGKEEIRTPDLKHGRRNADLGQGFYLTPDEDFAIRWARDEGVINEYLLDTSGLDVRFFERDLEWYRYISDNRRLKDGCHADVVIAPIANDTIFDSLGILNGGILAEEDALQLLSAGPEYRQVAIKSAKALKQLSWTGSKMIKKTREDREAFRREQDEYQKVLAEEIGKLI